MWTRVESGADFSWKRLSEGGADQFIRGKVPLFGVVSQICKHYVNALRAPNGRVGAKAKTFPYRNGVHDAADIP